MIAGYRDRFSTIYDHDMNSTPDNLATPPVKQRNRRRPSPARPDASNEQFLTRLSAAIRNDEMLLHYQPRYNCVTGRADYLEAMIRWQRPELGIFYPQTFLKAAENNGLVFAMDLWVFEQCCHDLKRLRKALDKQIRLAINVSSLDCESVYYSQKLIDLCEQQGLSLADFEFEISEGHSVRDMRKIVSFCQTLGEYGARFCLDNFGTGHASLERLYELPVHSIKFDNRFISHIGHSRRNDIILKNLFRLARELSVQTIAGGVETRQQYDFLGDQQCDQVQGFYFASPTRCNRLDRKNLFIADPA